MRAHFLNPYTIPYKYKDGGPFIYVYVRNFALGQVNNPLVTLEKTNFRSLSKCAAGKYYLL